MTSEKVTIEQIIQKLSETNIKNAARLNDLENKLEEILRNVGEQNKDTSTHLSSEIITLKNEMAGTIEAIQMQTRELHNTTITKLEESQQHWNHLAADMHDMKTELRKIVTAFTSNQARKSSNKDAIEEDSTASPMHRNSPTINECFDPLLSFKHSTSTNTHDENIFPRTPPFELATPTAHTIVIPPTSAIPMFHGKISENPRQFLIRIQEYTETVNHWNEKSLLNGISQFLRDTALEWYCQLRTSHRRPQTWTDFVALFLAQFNSPIRRARQEQEWRECKQRENETISEFVVRLRALWMEQKPKETEVDLVRHLLCKMRSDLLNMIGVSRCESLDEIIVEAQKIEEVLYQRSEQQRQQGIKHVSFRDGTPPASAHSPDNDIGLQTTSRHRPNASSQYSNYPTQPTTNQRYMQSNDQIVCYACGMNGHIKKNCPGQYNCYHQQPSRNYYSKNNGGAHAGRDHGAPM
jgi:hypothetical protein